MGLIVGISLVAMILEWTTFAITLQVATTLIAFLVTGACLIHIYQQHQYNYKKEQQLRKQVIAQIHELWPELPNHKIVREHLEQSLEVHGLEQRLKKLTRFQENSKALMAFVIRLKRQEAAKETLKDLGLSWGNKG